MRDSVLPGLVPRSAPGAPELPRRIALLPPTLRTISSFCPRKPRSPTRKTPSSHVEPDYRLVNTFADEKFPAGKVQWRDPNGSWAFAGTRAHRKFASRPVVPLGCLQTVRL